MRRPRAAEPPKSPLSRSGEVYGFATFGCSRLSRAGPERSRRRPHMTDLARPSLPAMLNKVPEVTLAFWVMKIMTTTVGETGADYLAVHVGLGTAITGGIMAAVLSLALFIQLRS